MAKYFRLPLGIMLIVMLSVVVFLVNEAQARGGCQPSGPDGDDDNFSGRRDRRIRPPKPRPPKPRPAPQPEPEPESGDYEEDYGGYSRSGMESEGSPRSGDGESHSAKSAKSSSSGSDNDSGDSEKSSKGAESD